MNSLEERIVLQYELHGLGIEEISDTEELEELAVKQCLLKYSTVYREELNKNEENDNELVKEEDVTKEECQEFLDIIKEVGRYSENNNERLRAAMFVVNEHKGRNDVTKNDKGILNQVRNLRINVLNFNKALEERRRLNAGKNGKNNGNGNGNGKNGASPVVDV